MWSYSLHVKHSAWITNAKISRDLVVFLMVGIICSPVSNCQTETGSMMFTWKLTISGQGKYQCSDPSDSRFSKIIAARSQLDCARRCKEYPDCFYYSFQRTSRRCHFGLSSTLPTSLFASSDCTLMLDADIFRGCFPQANPSINCSMPFQYENVEYQHCVSVNGLKCVSFSGQLINCIAPAGFYASQEMTEVAINQKSVPLPCISRWIVLMYRFNGAVDFDRSWNDYKKGFGDVLTSEFWIGNDNINMISNQPTISYRLRVEFQALVSGKWYYAEYADFSVDSEANGYRIHLSGFTGNAGDSLTNTAIATKWNHDGMKFSTKDADNDLQNGGSCSVNYPSGWWFNNCWYACLTCVYSDYAFSWYMLYNLDLEAYGRLRTARMMIDSRPN